MSSFHPVLGLLAVAVCISYAEGAPVSPIQKDDITSQKLHNLQFPISSLIGKNYGPLPSALYNEKNEIANNQENQVANEFVEENYQIILQEARSRKLNDLGSKKDNGVRYKKSGSGSVAEEIVEGRGLSSKEQYYSLREISSGFRKNEEVNSNSAVGRELGNSQSEEEDCDEDEETDPTSFSPTPPNEETGATDDGCESEEDGVSSSTESPESTSESNAWRTTDNHVVTSPRRTTQRTQKPRDPNRSSGSFHESNSAGVEFSDSVSAESNGRSTEFRENFTN